MKVRIQKVTEYKRIPKQKIENETDFINKKYNTSNDQDKLEIVSFPKNTTFRKNLNSYYYQNPIKVQIKSSNKNDHIENISPYHIKNFTKNCFSLHKKIPDTIQKKHSKTPSSIFIMKNCNYNKIYNINIKDTITRKMSHNRNLVESSLLNYTYNKPKTTSVFTNYKNFDKPKYIKRNKESGIANYSNYLKNKDYSNNLTNINIDSPGRIEKNIYINNCTEPNFDSLNYINQLGNSYQDNFFPLKTNTKRKKNAIENIYIEFNNTNTNNNTNNNNYNNNINYNNSINNNEISDDIFPKNSRNHSVDKKDSEKIFCSSLPSISQDVRKIRQYFVKFGMKKSPSDYILHSESRDKYDKNDLGININDLILFENKISNILSVLNVINTFREHSFINATEECKEFLIFYFESSLKGKFILLFNIDNQMIIESSVNLFLFCIILCYHLSNNNLLDNNILSYLNDMLNLIKINFLLYIKQLLLTNNNEKVNKVFLNNLIKYKIFKLNTEDEVVKKIFCNCRNIMTNDLNKIITFYKKNNSMYLNDFIKLFNNISLTSEKDLQTYFYKKLLYADIKQVASDNEVDIEKYIPKKNYKEYYMGSGSNRKSAPKSKREKSDSNFQIKPGLFSFLSMIKNKAEKE